MPKKTSEKSDDQALLETARKRFDLAVDAESDIRTEALDDLEFRSGKQWPDEVKKARELDRRPCLTINRLPQFVRQVTNDQRQNRPSIKVSPVDESADIDTARVYQGLIRHIEYNSNADVAYDTAFEGAATKGLGYLRVITDYVDPTSFDQEIFIKRIRNSFSVYVDPHYQEPDGSDMDWGFIFEVMSADDYKNQFKSSELASMQDWSSIGDNMPGWVMKDSVRVAEYFYKTFKEVEIALLSNKQVVEKSSLPETLPEGLTIVSTRMTILPAIQWCKINGVEVLEKTDWLGQWIPIIPVLGDELDINGRKVLEGIVRHAKDPQRMYNYWASSETETIALAPRAPFIGVEGQFEGHENEWKSANIKNHAFLQYKPKSIGGVPVGPPQRNVFEPPVQAITQARAQSSDDLKATTGIYDATLGNRSNENSGIAIQRRNSQAQVSNFHYIDNLSRALRHVGRIIVDLIPKVYDTPRIMRIIGEDGTPDMVKVNEPFQEGGQLKQYALGVGKYDVTVSTGPSYATKRQEAAQTMLDFTKALPQTAPLISDLIVRNMDWPGAQQIADRLKKGLPPGVAEDDKNAPPIPPQVQAKMQQMDQMIQTLTQHLNSATHKIETKTLELESKERIELTKIQAELEIALATLGQKDAQALLKHEIDGINQRMQLLNVTQPIDTQNDPAAGQQPALQPSPSQPPTGGSTPGSPMGV